MFFAHNRRFVSKPFPVVLGVGVLELMGFSYEIVSELGRILDEWDGSEEVRLASEDFIISSCTHEAKFKSRIKSVREAKPQNKGTTVLVPLSNSLYVPGHLSDAEKVFIDVGTGCYVKKCRVQAPKYHETKVECIRTNLDTLQEAIQKKQENMSYPIHVMDQSQAQPPKV
ncbi:hypothetical protein CY34DRAFT_18292 [Suillus luteus UH-Slu-Lm8-n1]|uniref:Prefoldin subunit 5 n=1 Tax=Suillus luteus UH-Slu-Lm8-n1 TaxID=930992 RepID=A0A0D0ANJ6_9AGAM|nr:hypothetical protein CY34DRAFT_18292 [Suillus luteus UH-Slu-Lm8-n1]